MSDIHAMYNYVLFTRHNLLQSFEVHAYPAIFGLYFDYTSFLTLGLISK